MTKTYENEKGNLKIDVSENAMEAYLTIKLTRDVINEEEIKELINKAGIVYGFDTAADENKEAGIEKEYDVPFLIAKGGLDPFKSELVCKFEAETCYAPGKDPSRVSLTGWCFVEAGTKLADIKVDENSNAIKNIHGVTLEQRDLHSLYSSQYIDRNVTFKDSEKAIYSTIKGYPYLNNDGKVGVVDVLGLTSEQINDAKYLHFKTHVDIDGPIKDCGLLSVEGNVTVHGNVDNCAIYATGSIHVDGTVSGCKPIGLISHRDITFNSGRATFFHAKSTIKPERQVIDSRMVAGDAVVGPDRTFEISGGSCYAANYISGAYAGDRFNSATRIEITQDCYPQMLKNNLQKIIDNKLFAPVIIDELKSNLDLINEDSNLGERLSEENGISFKGKIFPGVELVVNGKLITMDKVESDVVITF